MTPEQADALVDRILGAFPGHGWPYTTVALYAETLERVEHPHGARAVNRAITTLDQPPSLKWLLDTAHAEAARTAGVALVPVDADAGVGADLSVVQRVRRVYSEATAELNREGGGLDGHWHGGPNPCQVCGGIAPHLATSTRTTL